MLDLYRGEAVFGFSHESTVSVSIIDDQKERLSGSGGLLHRLFTATEKTAAPGADVELEPTSSFGTELRVVAHDSRNLRWREAETVRDQFLHSPRDPVKGLLETEEDSDQTFLSAGPSSHQLINQIDDRRIERLGAIAPLGSEEAGIGDFVGETHRQAFLTLTDRASPAPS